MPHSRYSVADAYVIEELKRRYHSADPKGRIQVLRSVFRKTDLPYDLALMAVEDSSAEVRQWIARFGRSLDYSELVWPEQNADGSYTGLSRKFPEKNLEHRLKDDPDPFVRACLRENPRLHRGVLHWKPEFDNATHLERLALVRNPLVGEDLIDRLFDPEDQQLNITMEERKELIAAFLTNAEALNLEQDDVATKLGDKIWPLAFKWQLESGMPAEIIWYVPAQDKAKAQVYRSCQDPRFRETILERCTPDDAETVALGMKDSDEKCRMRAAGLREATKEQQRSRRPYRNLVIALYILVFGYPVATWLVPSFNISSRTQWYTLAIMGLLFMWKFAAEMTKWISETYEKTQMEYKILKTEIAELREDVCE